MIWARVVAIPWDSGAFETPGELTLRCTIATAIEHPKRSELTVELFGE